VIIQKKKKKKGGKPSEESRQTKRWGKSWSFNFHLLP